MIDPEFGPAQVRSSHHRADATVFGFGVGGTRGGRRRELLLLMLLSLLMVMVESMTMGLVKEVVRELRSMVRCRDVARVLAVEPEPDRRWVVVMVVLIWWRVLRKRTVLEMMGLEEGLGGVVLVDGVGQVGDEGGA